MGGKNTWTHDKVKRRCVNITQKKIFQLPVLENLSFFCFCFVQPTDTQIFMKTFSFGDNGQKVMHDRMACQDMLLTALHMLHVVVNLMVFHPVVSQMLDVGC